MISIYKQHPNALHIPFEQVKIQLYKNINLYILNASVI